MHLNRLCRAQWIGLLLSVAAGSPRRDARLADAVMRGDKEVVRSLRRPRDHQRAAAGWHHRFALGGSKDDVATAEALIKAGADVKAANRYGVTPMNLAATNGNAAMIRKLLDAGVDPNTANPGGETASDDGGAHRQGRCGHSASRSRRERQRERHRARADRADVGRARKSHRHGQAAARARRRHQCAHQRHDAQRRVCACPRRRSVRDRDHPAARFAYGRWRHDAAAVRGSRRQYRDDAAAARSAAPISTQSSGNRYLAVADRSAQRAGRDRHRVAREGRRSQCRRRLPPRRAVRGHRSAQLQSRKIWRSSHRRARSHWI